MEKKYSINKMAKKYINDLEEKDYALYTAYLIWNLHKEIDEHMLIAHKTKEFDKHFAVHLCNYNSSRILMDIIKHYFPEMYKETGKSINQHYQEAEKYIKDKLNKESICEFCGIKSEFVRFEGSEEKNICDKCLYKLKQEEQELANIQKRKRIKIKCKKI